MEIVCVCGGGGGVRACVSACMRAYVCVRPCVCFIIIPRENRGMKE